MKKIVDAWIWTKGRRMIGEDQSFGPENTNFVRREADPLFDEFVFNQTGKSIVNSTYAKQLNPNK